MGTVTSTVVSGLRPDLHAAVRQRVAVREQPYMNPYFAGVGLGLVLLAAFIVMGRGLGASGAFSTVVAASVDAVAPSLTQANPAYQAYLGEGVDSPIRDWLLWEIIGVTLGGALSAKLAGRFRHTVERGDRISDGERLLYAFGGGSIMGFAAKLARGCTSGQALTGGALLSLGSWLFIVGAFGAAYAVSPLFRRHWT